MKALVLKDYIDRETKELHTAGKEIEVSEERAKEILNAGKYIKVIEEKTKPINKMTVEELKAYAAENNIDLGEAKTKAEIIAVIEGQQ